VAVTSIPEPLARELHRASGASTWSIPLETFTQRLIVSASARFATASPSPRDVEEFLRTLHLSDLALACACASGHDAAWEHFVREMRPALYAAARTMAPPDRARDLADSLYARLLGVDARGEKRTSLFDYYHGRARLSTWLRTVLAQRHVDELRQASRTVPLDDEAEVADRASSATPDPRGAERMAQVQGALDASIAALDARDRLRLGSYYAQGLTLAETGRLLNEHEATVSRQLARTRKTLRQEIERRLRDDHGMSADLVQSCLQNAAGAPELDVSHALVADDG